MNPASPLYAKLRATLIVLRQFPPRMQLALVPYAARFQPLRRLKPAVEENLNLDGAAAVRWARLIREAALRNFMTAGWLRKGGWSAVAPFFETPDFSDLARAHTNGKGVLVAGAHLGAAKMAAACVGQRFPLHVLAAALDPALGKMMRKADRNAARDAKLAADFVRAFLCLRNGGMALANADARFGAARSVRRLVGVEVVLSTGPADLMRRTGCESVFAIVTWRRGRLVLETEPGPAGSAGPEECLDRYAGWLDTRLRTDPECYRFMTGVMEALYDKPIA